MQSILIIILNIFRSFLIRLRIKNILWPLTEEAQKEQIDKIEEVTYKNYYNLLNNINKRINQEKKINTIMTETSLKKRILQKLDEHINKLRETENKYVRLKERYKHEKISIHVKLAIDWLNYLNEYSNMLTQPLDNKYNWDQLTREKTILHEIERRFDKMLEEK